MHKVRYSTKTLKRILNSFCLCWSHHYLNLCDSICKFNTYDGCPHIESPGRANGYVWPNLRRKTTDIVGWRYRVFLHWGGLSRSPKDACSGNFGDWFALDWQHSSHWTAGTINLEVLPATTGQLSCRRVPFEPRPSMGHRSFRACCPRDTALICACWSS